MFEAYQELPADPLLGLITAYREDSNPNKVDLGVGVYRDENGDTPIMQAIQQAMVRHMDVEDSKSYIGPLGVPGFVSGIRELIFGAGSSVDFARIGGVQTPGGCGALRVGSELLARHDKPMTVWVSDPTWANHVPLISSTGLPIKTYPYFDPTTGGINFNAMDEQLATLGQGDAVLLHGCCHNPTGADLSVEQWQQITERAEKQGFIPFIDIAYQGLGDGLDQDVEGVRYLLNRLPEVVVASSCSKNFGLYRERTGALFVQTANTQQASAIQTQIQDSARANYSMPPAYGGYLVDYVLNHSELRQVWESELNEMATRVKSLRQGLVDELASVGVEHDFSFIVRQKGMFSFLGLSREQVSQLREEFSIYMADSSRINVAGLNQKALGYVAEAVKSIL